ncbi:MAG: hypothetical protein ACM3NV_02025 [Syntrophothermus sp.]
MPKQAQAPKPIRYPIRTPILVVAAVAALVALGSATALAAGGTRTVVKKAPDPALGKTILTTIGGHTLYSLSAETKGRFICVNAGCLADWRPLVVAKGVRPKGPVALGTRLRPDGRRQVTFKGLPLYSFTGDLHKGEANGEGIMDVGTWHAAITGPLVTRTEPQPQPTSPYSPPSEPTLPQTPY